MFNKQLKKGNKKHIFWKKAFSRKKRGIKFTKQTKKPTYLPPFSKPIDGNKNK